MKIKLQERIRALETRLKNPNVKRIMMTAERIYLRSLTRGF